MRFKVAWHGFWHCFLVLSKLFVGYRLEVQSPDLGDSAVTLKVKIRFNLKLFKHQSSKGWTLCQVQWRSMPVRPVIGLLVGLLIGILNRNFLYEVHNMNPSWLTQPGKSPLKSTVHQKAIFNFPNFKLHWTFACSMRQPDANPNYINSKMKNSGFKSLSGPLVPSWNFRAL